MDLRDEVLPTSAGPVPALWAGPPREAARATVLLLHGLGADKSAHAKELASLAAHGFRAVAIDAPQHGARRGPLPARVMEGGGAAAHEGLLELVDLALAELPAVLDALAGPRGRVATVGISMGAFVALGAHAREPRIAATVSFLGSPDWAPRAGAPTPAALARMAGAPARHPENFAPRALMMVNAARDESVPVGPARAFAAAVEGHYRGAPTAGAFRYLEYPESGHFMRGEDWDAAWAEALAFLAAHA